MKREYTTHKQHTFPVTCTPEAKVCRGPRTLSCRLNIKIPRSHLNQILPDHPLPNFPQAIRCQRGLAWAFQTMTARASNRVNSNIDATNYRVWMMGPPFGSFLPKNARASLAAEHRNERSSEDIAVYFRQGPNCWWDALIGTPAGLLQRCIPLAEKVNFLALNQTRTHAGPLVPSTMQTVCVRDYD